MDTLDAVVRRLPKGNTLPFILIEYTNETFPVFSARHAMIWLFRLKVASLLRAFCQR